MRSGGGRRLVGEVAALGLCPGRRLVVGAAGRGGAAVAGGRRRADAERGAGDSLEAIGPVGGGQGGGLAGGRGAVGVKVGEDPHAAQAGLAGVAAAVAVGVGEHGARDRGGIQQHRHVAREVVGDGEVGVPVTVQVAHRHRGGEVAGGEVGRGAEAAGAVAEQHRHVARAEVGEVGDGDGEVGVPITVQVAHRHREGRAAGGEVGGAGEADLGRGRGGTERQSRDRRHSREDRPAVANARGVGPTGDDDILGVLSVRAAVGAGISGSPATRA